MIRIVKAIYVCVSKRVWNIERTWRWQSVPLILIETCAISITCFQFTLRTFLCLKMWGEWNAQHSPAERFAYQFLSHLKYAVISAEWHHQSTSWCKQSNPKQNEQRISERNACTQIECWFNTVESFSINFLNFLAEFKWDTKMK